MDNSQEKRSMTFWIMAARFVHSGTILDGLRRKNPVDVCDNPNKWRDGWNQETGIGHCL
jgi:hypothetical protein